MNNTLNASWQTYTKAWSEVNKNSRKTLLKQCLTSSAIYCDPNGTASGLDNISDYMAQFQQQIPGGFFKIKQQTEHNQKLLTQWELFNANDEIIMQGTSYGEYDLKGYLFKMTGFF